MKSSWLRGVQLGTPHMCRGISARRYAAYYVMTSRGAPESEPRTDLHKGSPGKGPAALTFLSSRFTRAWTPCCLFGIRSIPFGVALHTTPPIHRCLDLHLDHPCQQKRCAFTASTDRSYGPTSQIEYVLRRDASSKNVELPGLFVV